MASRTELTTDQVAAFRLRRNYLAGKGSAQLAAIARDTCGVQAQVMSAAELGFSVRKPRVMRAAIRKELWEKRTLVKTSCMRGTLHILAASDFTATITALRSRQVRLVLQIIKRYGVLEKEACGVMEAAVETLSKGPLTRRELTERVLSMGLVRKKSETWFRNSWWGVFRQALFEGLICYGPDRNREVSLVRTDQWLPRQRKMDELEAQCFMARRYLGAYGPADARDFAKWSGLSMPEAKRAFAGLGSELSPVACEGRKGFALRDDRDELFGARLDGMKVRLLPSFDSYLLAHNGKDHLIAPRHYKKVYRKAGWISQVVLASGRVVGLWEVLRERDETNIAVTPFEKFSPAVRSGIEEESARIKKFVDAI